MKILFIAFLLVSTNCFAEWEVALQAKSGTLTYVDEASKVKTGTIVRMLSMTDLKIADSHNGKTFKSIVYDAQYDCKAQQKKFTSVSAYSDNLSRGQMIAHSGAEPWQHIAVGSVDEGLWKIACGILKPR